MICRKINNDFIFFYGSHIIAFSCANEVWVKGLLTKVTWLFTIGFQNNYCAVFIMVSSNSFCSTVFVCTIEHIFHNVCLIFISSFLVNFLSEFSLQKSLLKTKKRRGINTDLECFETQRQTSRVLAMKSKRRQHCTPAEMFTQCAGQ